MATTLFQQFFKKNNIPFFKKGSLFVFFFFPFLLAKYQPFSSFPLPCVLCIFFPTPLFFLEVEDVCCTVSLFFFKFNFHFFYSRSVPTVLLRSVMSDFFFLPLLRESIVHGIHTPSHAFFSFEKKVSTIFFFSLPSPRGKWIFCCNFGRKRKRTETALFGFSFFNFFC